MYIYIYIGVCVYTDSFSVWLYLSLVCLQGPAR